MSIYLSKDLISWIQTLNPGQTSSMGVRVKMTEKSEWCSHPLGAPQSGPWQSPNPT